MLIVKSFKFAPYFLLLMVLGCQSVSINTNQVQIPSSLQPYVGSIEFDNLGDAQPRIFVEKKQPDMVHIRLVFDLLDDINQDDWQINIKPAFQPDFHWSPHLTPTDDTIIDQHCFRSPALIVRSENKSLTLIPDLHLIKQTTPTRWYLDLNAPKNTLTLGMSDYDVERGLFYVRKHGAAYPAGKVEIGFYLFTSNNPTELENPFRRSLAFLWQNYGQDLFESGLPLKPQLEPYIRHTYNWAFNTWADSIWQEFELDGKTVGAPVFIVNVTQSPNYPGPINEREFRSIWNQAWFSSLRSASGLFRYARRTGDQDLLEKSLLTKELALAAPLNQGFFDTVIATEMETIEIDGQNCNRSKGWQTAFWGNSDRNPVNRPPGQPRIRDCSIAPYHVLDMSWTTLLMLRWYEELEEDSRLLDYAQTYAHNLLKLQDPDGFFPAWLNKSTLKPLGIIDQSPETSMSVTFLLKLYQLTSDQKYKTAALKAMDAVINDIVSQGRWEDFETYWSSSSYCSSDLIGKKITRNNMYKQCNFSIFWTAEALFEAYKTTGSQKYLKIGQQVLDELLMTQASWQPPYMYVNVLGGFGVMNCDGEWLDSRQSLFAEIIVKYGLELNHDEYIQRGLAALRSSFVMMYCPENPQTKLQWEKRHPFFGPEDYGFTMENYAHGGRTSPEGVGMGVFTIYDWG
ncbi:MAG: hypothetical protein GY869_13185, partial [Planctomycetes bacterium]|nr:hypothetical protein [Planctomycetota bacterium]